MPELRFEDQVYQVDDYDTVLNTLLKNGHAIPNFCRGGICHSCMMKAEEGTPLAFTQIGLSDELIDENYFLTCQCAVYAPMTIRRPDKNKRTRFVAMVSEKQLIAENVVKVVLNPSHEFVYQAGQYTTLISVEGLMDDFPIASVRGEEGGLMEFHITNDSEKPLSQYIFSELEVGDGLEIQTALGDCYYGESLQGQDLLVIGVDAALASGLSVIGKALQENHEGTINLISVQRDVELDYFNQAVAAFNEVEKVSHELILSESDEALLTELKERIDSASPSTKILVAARPELTQKIISLNPEACFSISVEVE